MLPLYLHVKELKYRFFYVIFALVITLIVAWNYRYTLVHCYISGVTNILYAIDIGEEMRIGVFLSLYTTLLCTLPYISYNYYCYICPGIYKYEYNRTLLTFIFTSTYILAVYLISHWYIWPHIYNFLMETYMGTDRLWGISISYMPRLASITLWSVLLPSLCTLFSLFPLLIIITVPITVLKTYRKFWYITSIILASFLCPAVPLIQLWCTLLLCGIYEITLLYLCITYTRD
jgi:sec-independent protein translocase protein TatC